MASSYLRWRSGLTGGGADDLDGISGADVTAGDVCLVADLTNKKLAFYVVEDPIGVVEASPHVIIPDTTPSTKGWRRYRTVSSALFEDSADIPVVDPTASGVSLVVFGDTCDALGEFNVISGGYDNSILESASSSDFSVIAGGSGNDLDSALYSVISGGRTHAITAGADYAVINGGRGNTADADYTTVDGGAYATAYLYGQKARASGKFSVVGDAQQSTVMARKSTTNATPVNLFLDGSALRIVLPASKAWRFSISLVGRQYGGTSGTAGDTAFWTITGGIKRDGAGNTALVGTPAGTGVPGANDRDAAAAAWSVAVTADDTNEALDIAVTGEADKSVRWVAKIDLVEVG